MKRSVFVGLCVALASCGGSDPADVAPTPVVSASSGAAAFRELGVKGGNAKVKITYKVAEPDGSSYDLVFAQDPPKRSFRATDSGGKLVIADGANFVACDIESCFELPGLGAEAASAAAPFLGSFAEGIDAISGSAALAGFAAAGTRTIAGRAATCASWKPVSWRLEQCLDVKTGVALSFGITDAGGTSTAVATSFGDPAPSDFTPTHSVEPIPTDFVTPSPSA